MSVLFYLFQSWLIGVVIAAIIGPMSMLFIKRAFETGFYGAILIGLGVALADGAYGLVAALGISTISQFLLKKTVIIKTIGGLFLLYLSYKEIKNITVTKTAHINSKSSIKILLEVFFLTLANPVTILSFMGVFASITNGPATILESLSMTVGIFLGSMSWWIILGLIISKIRYKISKIWIQRIKYLSAIILGGFGIAAIMSGL